MIMFQVLMLENLVEKQSQTEVKMTAVRVIVAAMNQQERGEKRRLPDVR